MGRHLGFDPETAVAAAMRIFWLRGYEGTTLDELCEAMGIQRPSLYGQFKSKAALFRRCLAYYERTELDFLREALAQPAFPDVIEGIVRGYVKLATSQHNPDGTLGFLAAAACSEAGEEVRSLLLDWRRQIFAQFKRRFDMARREGELPPGTKAGQIAHLMLLLMAGISIQAKAGATARDLSGATKLAIASLRRGACA